MESLTFKYCFTLEKGLQQIYTFLVDAGPMELLLDPAIDAPGWTRLDRHTCPGCPLSPDEHKFCPLALNLVEIVETFEGIASYEKVKLEVVTSERYIAHDTTVQRGLSSIMGLLIAVSACPRTHFFKPMARYHLPLATREETIYRAAATYLLARYFLSLDTGNGGFELDGLLSVYDDIQVLNSAVADRLREATDSDSSVNAIILLDAYAKAIPFEIAGSLNDVRPMFEPFLGELGKGGPGR